MEALSRTLVVVSWGWGGVGGSNPSGKLVGGTFIPACLLASSPFLICLCACMHVYACAYMCMCMLG